MDAPLKIVEILQALSRHEVEFIVVGGVASILRGSPLMTQDVDVVYSASEGNIRRLAEALRELKAHYKDPAGRYIEPDVSRLASMRLHLLRTTFGPLDVLRSVGDGLDYDGLLERSDEQTVEDFRVRVLDVETLIETKEFAGRPKDQNGLLYLRQLLAEIKESAVAEGSSSDGASP